MTATQPIAAQLRVTLSQEIFAKYQEEAIEYGVDVEQLLESRLKECVAYNSTTPLYFNDDQRRELERLTGKNLRGAAEALAMIRRAMEVKVNGLPVSFNPLLLERLRTRLPRGTEFGTFLQNMIVMWAEGYCGLR